jgi:hypothetical protein
MAVSWLGMVCVGGLLFVGFLGLIFWIFSSDRTE